MFGGPDAFFSFDARDINEWLLLNYEGKNECCQPKLLVKRRTKTDEQ